MYYNAIEKTMPPEKLAEMDVMLADASIPYEHIAEAYGLTGKTVAKRALKIGAPLRSKHQHSKKAEASPIKNLRMVDAQLEILAAKQKEVLAEIERLQQLREELSLRFERDGDDVLVYGVDSAIGAGPLRASAHDWLRFLNNDGGRKLREYCVAVLKTAKEAHHGKA